MIYYLIRPPEIADVETDARAARLEREGYERVPAWRFVYWWSIRDARAYARLRREGLPARQGLPAPIERVPVTQIQITCLNAGCPNHGTGMRVSFCELCGSKVGTAPHTKLGFAIDQGDVREEIDELLVGPSGDEYWRWSETNAAHLWMPNHDMPGRDPRLEERDPFALFEIGEGQREAEIEVFQSTFSDALDVLRERYGNLTLHWGIIQDYS